MPLIGYVHSLFTTHNSHAYKYKSGVSRAHGREAGGLVETIHDLLALSDMIPLTPHSKKEFVYTQMSLRSELWSSAYPAERAYLLSQDFVIDGFLFGIGDTNRENILGEISVQKMRIFTRSRLRRMPDRWDLGADKICVLEIFALN